MPLPFILSPYLRPCIYEGQLVFDNGVTSTWQKLDALQEAVVRVLWTDHSAVSGLEQLGEQYGYGVLSGVLESLFERAILFSDQASCDKLMYEILDSTFSDIPFLDQIELTNHCPMRCQFCPRGIAGRISRPKGFMSLDLFMSLLRQCHPGQKNYRPLELHHLGESLLHPEVGRFVEEAGRMDIPTEMSVNPALLSFDIAKRLVDGGIRRIVISLDGMDDETLTAIRGPAALYSKAEPNLDRLLGYVATIKDPPSIVIQMIDLQRNIHQREAFIQRWGHSGLPTVQAYIKDLDGDDPDLGSPSPHPLSFLCTYPWRSVAVLWDGRVVPCCRDADADITLGDLNTQSLYEIWNGAIAQQLREYHRAAEMPADHLCRSCPWFRSNFVLHKPHRHPDLARRDYLRW